MKKIVLTTTVLIGTAGLASAEVTLSGNGRMGIIYAETTDVGDKETAFSSRIRADITMKASTDGGLEFGGKFGIHDAHTNTAVAKPITRAQFDTCTPPGSTPEAQISCFAKETISNEAGGATQGLEGTVYISGAFGKLSMGAPDNAAKSAVGELAGVGYTGLGDTNEIGYYVGDKEMALYEYSASGFTGYVSIGQPNNAEDNYALGAKYVSETYSVGVGYEDIDAAGVDLDRTAVTVSASATFSGVTAKALYGTEDRAVGNDLESFGVSAIYKIDAITVTGFYRQAKRGIDTFHFQGIGASYDLGGKAKLAGGIVNDDGLTKADLGVTFEF